MIDYCHQFSIWQQLFKLLGAPGCLSPSPQLHAILLTTEVHMG